MVDTDHLDRARSVYSDDNGVTQVSPDLRVASEKSDQAKSGYVAYAAVGIATADAVLPGARSVIVEARSDQHYLTAIKNYLVAKGHLRPTRDILFIPGGNVRGTRALSGLLMGKDDELPFVILDSDRGWTDVRAQAEGPHRETRRACLSRRLPGHRRRRSGGSASQPAHGGVLDRHMRKPGGVDDDLGDVVRDGQAFVPQAEDTRASTTSRSMRVEGRPLQARQDRDPQGRRRSAPERSRLRGDVAQPLRAHPSFRRLTRTFIPVGLNSIRDRGDRGRASVDGLCCKRLLQRLCWRRARR